MLLKTLKEHLKKNNLTQVQVARLLGITQGALSLYLCGKRKISTQLLDRICQVLEIDIPQLYTCLPSKVKEDINVVGQVQAGLFKPVEEIYFSKPLSLKVHAPYQDCIFALKVKGDSMNKLYPDGSYLICCPLEKMPQKLKSGHKVICQRLHADGLVEATVKEYVETAEGIFLVPHSTNPEHKPIKLIQDDTTLTLTAVVIGSYHPDSHFSDLANI